MANYNVRFKGDGIVSVTCPLYVFECLIIPRDKVGLAVSKYNQLKHGSYFLVNSTESKSTLRYLYIGETTQGSLRFANHKSLKKEWNKAYLFVAENRKFSADTIREIENCLMKKYFDCKLYNLDNCKNSSFSFGDDADVISDQIIEMMSFFDYGIYKEIEYEFNDHENEIVKKSNIKLFSSVLLDEFDSMIKIISSSICFDALKLYRAYKSEHEGKNLVSLWQTSKNLELEFYCGIEDIPDEFKENVYDTTNRRRGKKRCAFRVNKTSDVAQAVAIIEEVFFK